MARAIHYLQYHVVNTNIIPGGAYGVARTGWGVPGGAYRVACTRRRVHTLTFDIDNDNIHNII